jgi:Putative helix-turn-helix protein, YlxM / p13 like.
MSKDSIKVNAYFKTAVKKEVDYLTDNLILSEKQKKIFTMYYLENQCIDFIADSVNSSRSSVCTELKIIRDRIMKLI